MLRGGTRRGVIRGRAAAKKGRPRGGETRALCAPRGYMYSTGPGLRGVSPVLELFKNCGSSQQ
eukprot:5180915-Pyramimonas_sp.AAC.1